MFYYLRTTTKVMWPLLAVYFYIGEWRWLFLIQKSGMSFFLISDSVAYIGVVIDSCTYRVTIIIIYYKVATDYIIMFGVEKSVKKENPPRH